MVLTDGSASATINTANSNGVSGWMIDGVTRASQDWYWYRASANGPSFPINTLSAPVDFTTNGNFGSVSYSAGGLTITASFLLSGGTPQSGVAVLAETVRIHNAAGLSGYSLFNYATFDNAASDEMVQFANPATVEQQSASRGWALETVSAPTPIHHDAALYPTLLNRLGGNPGNLNDVNMAGPGNTEWAFQWNASGGTDLIISQNVHLQVPEPGTVALLLLGSLALLKGRVRAAVH